MNAEPCEILKHGVDEIRTGALRVQIFVAKDECAASSQRALIRDPEGTRMAKMQQPGG